LRRIFAEGQPDWLEESAAVSDLPDVSRKAPRVIVYSGKSKLETKLDQVGTKGYAVGFPLLVTFVMAQLPQRDSSDEQRRRTGCPA
jgi:hypothetical protein